jgi:hypothetical protein
MEANQTNARAASYGISAGGLVTLNGRELAPAELSGIRETSELMFGSADSPMALAAAAALGLDDLERAMMVRAALEAARDIGGYALVSHQLGEGARESEVLAAYGDSVGLSEEPGFAELVTKMASFEAAAAAPGGRAPGEAELAAVREGLRAADPEPGLDELFSRAGGSGLLH